MRPDRMIDTAYGKDPESQGETVQTRTNDTCVVNGALRLRCDRCDCSWETTPLNKPTVLNVTCGICLGHKISLRIRQRVWVRLYGGRD